MIKLKKFDLKSLRQVAMSDKMRMMRDPYYGERLMSALTPTEIAELFPKYYLRQLPDIGGFYKAVPTSMTAAKQAAYDSAMGRQTASVGGSTAASGDLAKNQKEAYAAAKAEGLSDSAARILVANMSGESLKNPGDHHWDVKHMSQGIVQWDPERAERIKNHFGAYPKDMSVAQQTKAAIWEMKTYYSKSFDALTNENLSTQQRLHTVVADYERPANVEGAVAQRMSFHNGLGQSVTNASDINQASNKETQAGTNSSQPQNDMNSLFGRAAQIGGVEMRQTGQGGGKCGRGARGLAGAIFGSSYFAQGIGGDGTAASLSRGNGYFQKSGLYNMPSAPRGDLSDPAYRASLPIGTVVSAAGGNARGEGHVQIKIGPGPNDWASDFNQKGTKNGILLGERYHSYTVHTPNEQGLKILSERNFPQVSGTTAEADMESNPTPVGRNVGPSARNAQQTQEQSESPGGQGTSTATVSPMGIPGMGMPMNMIPEMGMMGGPMNPMMMMQMMSGMMMGGGLGGVGSIAGMAMPIAATAVSALASSVLKQSNEGEGSGARAHGRRRHRHHARPHRDVSAPEPVDTTPIKHREDLGTASAVYESGKRGVHTISSGRKDPGGVSYGSHQLASKTGTMGAYLKSKEAKDYASRFEGLKPGTPQFNKVYAQVANEDPEGFRKSQESYITRTHYDPVYRHAKNLGYNVDDPRVQEALYSISVQHGGAKTIVTNAKSSASAGPEQQVAGLFSARRSYTERKGFDFSRRYTAEQRDILAMDIGKYRESPTQVAASPADIKTPILSSPGPTFSEMAQRTIGISPAYAEGKTTSAPASAFTPRRVEGNIFQQQKVDITPKDKIGADLSKAPSSPLIDQMNRTNMEVQGLRNDMREMAPSTVPGKRSVGEASSPPMGEVMNIHREPFNTPSMERATGRNFPDPHFEYGNNS